MPVSTSVGTALQRKSSTHTARVISDVHADWSPCRLSQSPLSETSGQSCPGNPSLSPVHSLFCHSLHLSVCPRSILPLHSTTSRAELLGWLSIDALKPLAENGQVDLDAPLSALLRGDAPATATTNGQQLAAGSQSPASTGEERPVKEFKRGRKYEGAFWSQTHSSF